MSIGNSVKLFVKSNYTVFKTFRAVLAMSGYFSRILNRPVEKAWDERIETVMLSPDNGNIKRVDNAGAIEDDVQIMHNGLKIHVGSYYGDGNTALLYRNKGVHEPQEEKVFEEIIKLLHPHSTMLELGAFWAFYSMSFQAVVKHGTNYLIEPDPHALLSGRNNFRLNNLRGHFFNYYVSDVEDNGPIPTITVDRFMELNNIARLNILHSDIQGFELKMLMGASDHLKKGMIDFLFISTHDNTLHHDCIKYLKAFDYQILCDANLDETYSWDGLVVAKHVSATGPKKLEISKKSSLQPSIT